VGTDGDHAITLAEWAASTGRSELDAVLATSGRVDRVERAARRDDIG
jgi:hypothetical protein